MAKAPKVSKKALRPASPASRWWVAEGQSTSLLLPFGQCQKEG
ncbi:hypothetical protein [Dysgonomonas sp. 521]|nr:hypothetical protein [Dysgonomonas sp. 521]